MGELTPHWSTSLGSLYCGDVMDVLPTLPEKSCHVCVTSPPFWGLRSYEGVQERVWGGNPACQHQWGTSRTWRSSPQQDNGPGGGVWNAESRGQEPSSRRTAFEASTGAFCSLCGAWRGALGLEPTVELYVSNLVAVMREAWRVMRDDGCVFLDIGDTYASGKPKENGYTASGHDLGWSTEQSRKPPDGLKPKDLCLVPERVALALQQNGWWVRNKIAWVKKAPMPGSQTDRFTNSWEPIFLLAKSQRYAFDMEAAREKGTYPAGTKGAKASQARASEEGVNSRPPEYKTYDGGRTPRDVWILGPDPSNWSYCQGCGGFWIGKERSAIKTVDGVQVCPTCGRTDAWLGHYAIFPRAIPARAIKAGAPERGCCAACGAPWVRVVEKSGGRDWHSDKMKAKGIPGELNGNGGYKRGHSSTPLNDVKVVETLGWEPACSCNAGEPVPCTVLEPFGGSLTTGLVAEKMGRRWICVETSRSYCDMGIRRIQHEQARGWHDDAATPQADPAQMRLL